MPYLSNSAETIIQSVIKMPFTRHNADRQLIVSKTPLIKGNMFYEKIEEGLYIIHSNMYYKANINYKSVNDATPLGLWLTGRTIYQP